MEIGLTKETDERVAKQAKSGTGKIFSEKHKLHMRKPHGPMSEEQKEIRRKSGIGKNKGKIKMYNLVSRENRIINPNNVQSYINNGYTLGWVVKDGSSNKGAVWMSSEELRASKLVKPEKVRGFLSNGYNFGRLLFKTNETITKEEQKCSLSLK